MSKGISIFYKLVSKNKYEVLYEYYGVDLNKEHIPKGDLPYDGLIQFKMEALKSKDIVELISSGGVEVLKECKYENHHSRLIEDKSGESYPFFAIKTISKIIRIYRDSSIISEKGCVVY